MVEETIMEKVEEKAVEKPTTFFEQTKCDRCSGELTARITSWFTTETICMGCSEKEDELKKKLTAKGKNPSDYEGCGYIPKTVNGKKI